MENNIELRLFLMKNGISHKRLAKQMGITNVWLSRVLSKPLSTRMRRRVEEAAEEILNNVEPLSMEKKFGEVICVTPGDGFERGCIYAQIGWNNGIHILRETEAGDVYELICCTGGTGEGLFNNWDDSGKPSFNPIKERK